MKPEDSLSETLDLSDEILKLTKSERERVLQDHFELQITQEALTALMSNDYIKSAMLSWSYIEEYFLPTIIMRLTKFGRP